MDTKRVDIAIIGAGTAGLNAVREAQKSGRSWLLIEQGPYGTTCARVGCMPSKLLIAAADAAQRARRAGEFGLHLEGPRIDGAAVMDRLRRERDYFAGAAARDTEALPRANRLRGQARFLDAGTLEVTPTSDDEDPPTRVTTAATVVATGSSPVVPPVFKALRHRLLTSDTVFELDDLPRSMAVVGTGIVGLELGQAFARLGVEVTFLDRSEHPGPCSDPAVLDYVNRVLPEELTLNMCADITSTREHRAEVEIAWHADGADRSATFDTVLLAAGRAPNLKPLNLEATSLTLDERGHPPWNPVTTQCGELPIFLAGDVDGYRPLLHEAGDEGRISGANAAGWPDVAHHERRAGLSIVFTDPQMAIVGVPYRDQDRDAICIGEVDFRNQGRARMMAVNDGIMRIYARRCDGVLTGAEMFGPQMEHMAHLLAWAVQEQTPVQHLLQMPIYHPTLEEGMRTALRDLARNLAVEEECRSEDMSLSPGM